jgi:hypothetical protein
MVLVTALFWPVPAQGGATESCLGQPVTIAGTPGSDEIVGTSGNDVILARGGHDRITARGGHDLTATT